MESAKIKFLGVGKSKSMADVLSNVWIANLIDMDGKFDPETGFFHESSLRIPDYLKNTTCMCMFLREQFQRMAHRRGVLL